MTTINRYSLNDYNEILFGTYGHSVGEEEIPMKYTLPHAVLSIISILANKFGSTPVLPPQQEVRQRKPRQSSNHNNKHTEESWISSRDFKPTMIIEKKEGADKIMNDIRSALNKISNKNYHLNRDMIIGYLNELMKDKEEKDDDFSKIANNIFDIASTNKFFSEIYANLYKDISSQFPDVFTPILTTFLEGFTNTMKTIKYVDQKDNYDDFCKYNKGNDKRKATSIFITNLVKVEVIQSNVLYKIIEEIQSILIACMDEDNRINEVEEITENIFLLITNNVAFLKSCTNKEIIQKIHTISTLKPKDKPSISSRAIFKCLDILDKCK